MAALPKTYAIVRKGEPCAVNVEDQEALVRLRSELDLIVRCGADFPADVFGALADSADLLADSDLAELRQVLQDAHHPTNTATMAEMDADFPSLSQDLEGDVIEAETQKIRDDIARYVAAAEDKASAGELGEAQPALDDESEPAAEVAESPPPAGATPDGEPTAERTEIDDDVVKLDDLPPEPDGVAAVETALEEMQDAADELAAVLEGPSDAANATEVRTGEAESVMTDPNAPDQAAPDTRDPACESGTAGETGVVGAQPAALAVAVDPADSESLATESRVCSDEPPPGIPAGDDVPTGHTDSPDHQGHQAACELTDGFQHLARFFAGQADRIWNLTDQRLTETARLAEQVAAAHRQVEALLGEVRNWRDQACQAAAEAQQLRSEALQARDEVQRTTLQALAKVDEAENAAARAHSEADRARLHCDGAQAALS